jgi:hypothetical protein
MWKAAGMLRNGLKILSFAVIGGFVTGLLAGAALTLV